MIDNEAEREKKEEEDCVVNELPDKVDEILKVKNYVTGYKKKS